MGVPPEAPGVPTAGAHCRQVTVGGAGHWPPAATYLKGVPSHVELRGDKGSLGVVWEGKRRRRVTRRPSLPTTPDLGHWGRQASRLSRDGEL